VSADLDTARVLLAQDIAADLDAATCEAQVSACVQRILLAGAGLVNVLVIVPSSPNPIRLGALVTAARRRTAPEPPHPLQMPARHQRPTRYPRRTR
jgi:hypothetical protein